MAILDNDIRSATTAARLVRLRRFAGTARHVGVSLGVLALGWAFVQAQAPASEQAAATSNVRFEVASIKRNKEAEAARAAVPAFVPVVPGRSQTLPGGRLRGPAMTVRELIRDAYGYRNRAHGEIVGAPEWIDKERYDVEARAAQEFPASTSMGLPPDAAAALRALLAERFNLKARVEVQRRPIYELVMHRADRRLGPNLTPAKGGCRSFFQREPVNTAPDQCQTRRRRAATIAPVWALDRRHDHHHHEHADDGFGSNPGDETGAEHDRPRSHRPDRQLRLHDRRSTFAGADGSPQTAARIAARSHTATGRRTCGDPGDRADRSPNRKLTTLRQTPR